MKENKTHRTFLAVLASVCVALTFSACAELLGTSKSTPKKSTTTTTQTATSTSASSTSTTTQTTTNTSGKAKADGSTSKGRKTVSK